MPDNNKVCDSVLRLRIAMIDERIRKTNWPALAVLVLVALLLRLPRLGQSLWFDEACMSEQRIGTLAQLLTTIHVDIHPPLYLVFAFLWNGIFGDSEVSLRIPSLLAGLASLPLVFFLARRWVGEGAAWLTVGLLAISPVHIWYSIEGRLYAPMLLLALVALSLFPRLVAGELQRRGWWAYAALVAAMLALHYYLAVFVALLFVAGLVAPRLGWTERRPRPLLWIHGAGLVAIAGWVLFKAKLIGFETSQGYLRPFTPTEVYRFLFQWSWTGNCLAAGAETSSPRAWAWLLFQGLGVLAFTRGLLELLRRRRELPFGPLLVAGFACLPAFLFVLPLVGMPRTYIERSLIASLPFFFVIASLGLVSLRPALLRRGAVALLTALSLANLLAYYGFGDRWTVYKPHPDWRAAAAWFGEELEAGAAGRSIFTPYPHCRSLPYYDARIQDARNLAPSADAARRGVAAFERVFGESLGGRLGSFAESIATDFEAGKAELARGTELFVRPLGDGRLESLDVERFGADGVFYLLDNRWHDSSDGRVERLARSPRLELLEQHDFGGIAVFSVRAVE